MSDVSVGAAIGSGFLLIRRKPSAVLLWGLVQVVAIGALMAMIAPTYMTLTSRMLTASASGAPPMAAMGDMMRMQGVFFLGYFAWLAVHAVVVSAVFRAVLRPEDGRFGYLRLGVTEVMFFLAMVVFYVLIIIGELVIGVPLMILGGVLIFEKTPGAPMAVILSGFVVAAAVIYFTLRLGMAWPMIVDDGKFRLFESWRVTKGRVLKMFLVALALIVMALIAEIVIVIISSVVFGGWLGRQPSSPLDMAAVFSHMTPVFIASLVVGIPVLGCVLAIAAAPWAWLYLRWKTPQSELTFT